MFGVLINSGVNNYGGVPLIGANTAANRPTARIRGRLFVDTTNNLLQYDTGSAWVNVGGSTISGSGAAGQVTFFSGATSLSGDNTFFWDNTNKRLGLNTTTPSTRIDIHGADNLSALNVTSDTGNAAIQTIKGTNRYRWQFDDINPTNGATGFPKFNWQLFDGSVTFINFSNTSTTPFGSRVNLNNLVLSGANTGSYSWDGINLAAARNFNTAVQSNGLFSINVPTQFSVAGFVFDSSYSNPNHTLFIRALGQQAAAFGSQLNFLTSESFGQIQCLNLNKFGVGTFATRLNVNNATDNSLFELNVNGNTYTGGLSPTILTVATATDMLRTATGYYVTATTTLTLPVAAGLNNVYYVIAGSGATITIQRNPTAITDDILNLAGTSVTSITLTPNQRCMLYVGGGTRTFLIFQA